MRWSSALSSPPLETAREDDATVDSFMLDLERAAAWNHGQQGKVYDESLWEPDFCRTVADRYDTFLQQFVSDSNCHLPKDLLSAETVNLAFKVLLKSQLEPDELSQRVRSWERGLGELRQTPLTDHLSLRLLTANGKSGNVGRVLSLLQLRKSRGFAPRQREFVYAVTALQAAQAPRRRNIFVNEHEQPTIDNPTRWLDAILINMHDRGFALTTSMSNRMLHCYAAGYTGKAVHHFYRVVRRPVSTLSEDERPSSTDGMPTDMFYLPDSGYQEHPVKVQLEYNRAAPPFYKKPAEVRGKLLYRPDSEQGELKLDRETDPSYSPALSGAFAFAESLQHGACGHDEVEFNTASYNALLRACVQRGALWRAMHLIDEVMPLKATTQPNTISYNFLLAGLARVGDVATQQEYYRQMQNAGLEPDAFTARAIVDGLLNLGDTPAAVTVVQDFFNQHSILPPYTTHIKILEFCLARDLIYEAKRYLYFLQQMWHWEPNAYHTESFVRMMRAAQKNTQLQRPALEKLFAYFGETLEDSDFL